MSYHAICKWCQTKKSQEVHSFCDLCGFNPKGYRDLSACVTFSEAAHQKAKEVSTNGKAFLHSAVAFAETIHQTQRRKGTIPVPYMNHVSYVAVLAGRCTNSDSETILGAYLPDVLEMSPWEKRATLLQEISEHYGEVVARLVLSLTDPLGFNREQNKRRQIGIAPNQSIRWQVIRIADKTANLHDSRFNPPDWSRERHLWYRDQAVKLAETIGNDHDWLRQIRSEFDAELKAFDTAFRF
jgi:(p)ppGpp synthase/HD superfamily hydrolase